MKLPASCLKASSTVLFAFSSLGILTAETTLTGDHVIVGSGSGPTAEQGSLVVSGNLSAWGGIDLGSTGGSTPLSAFQLEYHASGGLAKIATFDLTEASSGFLWRDNLVGTARPKMALDANNSLHLYGATGTAANIVLNGGNGRISLSGTGSGIYSGGNPVFSLDSAGKPVFGDGSPVNFSSVTAANASTAGPFTAAGGLGSGTDSYFNGVRVGRGEGNNIVSTVVGERALDSNTTGYNNLAMGWEALRYNTGGEHNLAIGSGSLRMNSMGASNTAVGNGTLSSNSTGNWNVAVGGAAMSSNTTGYQNVAVGERSMTDNTTGVYNTAVGAGALGKSTVADFNTALGSAALAETTTGHGNTGIGGVAMLHNKTGSNNTAVGGSSGYSLNGGNRNVMVGLDAGASYGSGNAPLVTPEKSIYIGANARGHSDADDNAIVIGTDAIGQGANTTVIGNTSTTRTKLFGKLDTAKVEITAAAPGDDALVVEGNTTLSGNTSLSGKVTISAPQGDISMGIYE